MKYMVRGEGGGGLWARGEVEVGVTLTQAVALVPSRGGAAGGGGS